MRQRSAKAASTHRRRVAMLKATTHGPQRCQWPAGCTEQAVDPDERLPRGRGGDPADRDNVQLLCRGHHDWKHAHPLEAAALGVTTPTACIASSADALTLRSMPPKRPITLRVPPAADDWITRQATEAGVSRSVVTRAMLSVATTHAREVQAKIATIKETG